MRERWILSAFLATQVMDGVLTYAGVTRGVGPEGNPLLVALSHSLGLPFTLLLAKSITVPLGVALYKTEHHGMLAFLTILYWILAIIPWTYLLVRG